MEINEDYSCENRGYLFKDCCIQGVSHHHLHWAGTQSWGEEWKSFIVKKGEAWVFLWRKLTGNSVQFSPSIMSDVLQSHGLQHTRLPCPSSTPRACSNSCPSSWWCHPTISSSSPAFNLSQHQGLFQWVHSLHQVAKVSASALVLPVNISGLISFRIDWLDLLAVSRVFSNITVQKHHFFSA